MIITADNPQILESIHSDLNKQNIKAELAFKDIDGTKGDIPTYINLATLGVTTVGTVIGYLSYLQTQKNHYIHYKYKDDVDVNPRELKFDNLTVEERDKKIKNIQNNFDKLEFLHVSK